MHAVVFQTVWLLCSRVVGF